MGRIKLDPRIRTVVENGVALRHRSLFVVIGEKAREQVPTLHHILAKANPGQRPSVLWCYSKTLGFSSHRQKRIKEIKKRKEAGIPTEKGEDLFEQFIASTKIQYCYYAESKRILGNTYGMVVLQDFEALSPNLLARTIETTEGGGMVVILLETVDSLKQIFTLSMDVHKRYRTEAHQDIVPRFNERFILSLATCKSCLVIDNCLNVLPISTHIQHIEPISISAKEKSSRLTELERLQAQTSDVRSIGDLLKRCKTHCQARVLLCLLDCVTEYRPGITCSITAARGRGKSAAMGLSLAGAVACGLTSIFVTSPSVENLRTLFDFVLKGLSALNYEEHVDFNVMKTPGESKSDRCIQRITIHRSHRQTIQYIEPEQAAASKLSQAELVVIDEAAAIPIPTVRSFISGDYMVFLASTISGYEGTGRSLSLKLLEQLRSQAKKTDTGTHHHQPTNGKGNVLSGEGETALASRTLYELQLEESIRYADEDPVEDWLNRLLCLNSVNLKGSNAQGGIPSPTACELFYVNRDSLFSFHPGAERFLAQLMSIYVAAHYKNSPDDLQMISDAPSHHLFALTTPVSNDQVVVPQILAVVQVCLEGSISKQRVSEVQEKGRRAAGDLIPWTLVQHYLDADFSALCGARIVRIAVHPDYQNLGYGSRAIELLRRYYSGGFPCFEEDNTKRRGMDFDVRDDTNDKMDIELDNTKNDESEERLAPRANLPPLLQRLQERRAEQLDWLGVSFGLNVQLLKFWKRLKFLSIYVRQTSSELTGEHSCIALSTIDEDFPFAENGEHTEDEHNWLHRFHNEFRRRLIPLLGQKFSHFSPHLAFSLLFYRPNATLTQNQRSEVLTRSQLQLFLSDLDLRRLAQYAKNMADDNLITDLVPTVATLYFQGRIDSRVNLDLRQAAALLAVGLQRKTIDSVAKELDVPINQAHTFFNKAIRRLSEHFDELCREAVERDMALASSFSSKKHQSADNASTVHKTGNQQISRLGVGISALPASLDDDDIADRQLHGDSDEDLDRPADLLPRRKKTTKRKR